MAAVWDVIIRPIVSEKSTALAEVANRYVCEVQREARKEEIRSAVEKAFKVNVTKVRTMIVHRDARRRGIKLVKRPNWKKAIISVRDGQKIEFFQAK